MSVNNQTSINKVIDSPAANNANPVAQGGLKAIAGLGQATAAHAQTPSVAAAGQAAQVAQYTG